MSKSTDKTIVAISELVSDKKNARRHSKRNIDEIKRSLVAFGQHAPLVVQRSTNRVLVGNGRLQGMRELGWSECWVHFVDDDDEKALKRALADNRTAELAEWDDHVLVDILKSLDDLDVPGWDDEELAKLIGDLDGVLDIDDLLEEVDVKRAIKTPLWLVARTDIADLAIIKQAAEMLRAKGIEVDLSHDD